MKKSIITTSWDDGHSLDKKLSSLLEKYEIPGTFYVPIENSERETLNEDDIATLSEQFDVGGHTYSHRFLREVSTDEARKEIREGKTALERITGKTVSCFCYPAGQYNSEIKRLVREAGFKGARTILPMRVSANQDPFELSTTVKLVENKRGQLFRYIKNPSLNLSDAAFCADMFKRGGILDREGWELAIEAIDHVVDSGGIFHLWEHSWKIDKTDRWTQLEKVLGYIHAVSDRDDVLLMDNSELLDYLGQTYNQ